MTLTNAHTHLELGWLDNYRPGVTGADFAPWIAGLIKRRRDLGDSWEGIYEASVEAGILELLSAGTTHVGDISASGKSIEPLLDSGLQGIVYIEVLGLDPTRAEESLNRARTLIEQWRPQERNGMRVGLSIHAPYSTSRLLWQMALDYAQKEALALCIHVAESPAEYDFLMTGEGPMVDEYYDELNLTLPNAPLATPIRFLEDLGALALKPLLVHAVQVDRDDIRRIAESGSSVVHCPRSNLRLRCGKMPLDIFLEEDVPVYLGTDSRASSPTLNVLEEMEVAAALHYGEVETGVIEAMARKSFLMDNEEL